VQTDPHVSKQQKNERYRTIMGLPPDFTFPRSEGRGPVPDSRELVRAGDRIKQPIRGLGEEQVHMTNMDRVPLAARSTRRLLPFVPAPPPSSSMFQGKSPLVGLLDEQYWSMFGNRDRLIFKFVQSRATVCSIISLALLYRLSLI
jgi:hypothetical protein